jgi:aspartokinase-like uncharacterized kinase
MTAGITPRVPIRVVKIGGSLLDWPPLPAALARWLHEQSPAAQVLLAGGGAMADIIRKADAQYEIGEAAAHWLCIEILSVSARLVAALLDAPASLATSYADLQCRIAGCPPAIHVFDSGELLRNHEQRLPGQTLPHDWSVTSDSIAARVATILRAEELVLLKSREPPANASLRELAASGYVDSFFPTIAGQMQCALRLVNLRACQAAPATQSS